MQITEKINKKKKYLLNIENPKEIYKTEEIQELLLEPAKEATQTTEASDSTEIEPMDLLIRM